MSDSIERNVEAWTGKAAEYAAWAPRAWSSDEVTWGQFGVPEAQVGALPDVAGRDVVELGCGTGYVSAWLARRGARQVVGLDPTPAQLATAARMQVEVGPSFPLVRATGESVPLRSASFDVAVSEYGAALWADPHRWIPEAARLLRDGGELLFLTTSVLFTLCAPDAEEPAGLPLQRPQRDLFRVEYSDEVGVEFHLAHGDWIRLLRSSGFEVLDLVELYAPEGAQDQQYMTVEWGSRWPVEELWRARKR